MDINQLSAFSDRIFIVLDEQEKKGEKGLIGLELPVQMIGRVLCVGPLVTSVVPGDRVMFHQFDELATPDASLVVIKESSLLGIFN